MLAVALGTVGGVYAAEHPPVLYLGEGGWAAISGPPDVQEPWADWRLEQGMWIGRLPEDEETIRWGDTELAVSEGVSPPLAPAVLPRVRNPFGPCVIRSLSVRFESQIRAHRWSLVFAPEGQDAAFAPLVLPQGPPVALVLSVEDVDSGRVWRLHPERMGREGGMFERQKGEARLYAGFFDDKQVEWHLVVARGETGRRIVQGRIRTFEGPARRFRLRAGVQAGAMGRAVLQDELPPAVVAENDGLAVAMFMDLAEPRRHRVWADEADVVGMEFDLLVTRATGNFPRSATFSVEVDAWLSAGPEEAEAEAIQRLAPLVTAASLDGVEWPVVAYEPSRLVLTHPGGFHDDAEVLQYLMLRMTGLFEDSDWFASGFLGNALDAFGRPRMDRRGDRAVLAVNADPDLETVLELGQNRGVTLLMRILRDEPSAVWIRATGVDSGLDHSMRALHMGDYPAIWEEGSEVAGVDLRHAEVELMASLACVLRNRNIRLLVSDGGALAPFTTAYADGIVCESDDPGVMRRQHALAAGRPVFWRVDAPAPEARELAGELGWDLRWMP